MSLLLTQKGAMLAKYIQMNDINIAHVHKENDRHYVVYVGSNTEGGWKEKEFTRLKNAKEYAAKLNAVLAKSRIDFPEFYGDGKYAKKNPLPRSRAARPAYIGKRSQITGRAPSPRLKKRRAKNTERGYFPNPAKKFDGFVATYTVSAELNRDYWVVLGKFSDKDIAVSFAKLCAKKYPDCAIEVTDNK